jgi:UDP-N-acetylmuramoyl-L-alanyl-D-glutamate--2,6-diaminopimelate ligase
MKLKTLLSKIPSLVCKGSKDIEITGLCSHSKFIFPGNLFFAKKGGQEDGYDYIEEAIQAGAVGIVSNCFNPLLHHITQIITSDILQLEALLAARYYENPMEKLLVCGVTGTSGKTTCSWLVKQFIEFLGLSCGVLGTNGYYIGTKKHPSPLTTPDIITSNRFFHEMVVHGCHAVSMEASSHALDQNRLKNIGNHDLVLC